MSISYIVSLRRCFVQNENESKLTELEFVRRAIKKLRGKYKGIHTIYSGFNDAFKIYFGTNPIETTQRLAQEGKIVIRPVKGGVMIYLPEETPGNLPGNVNDTINKILED
jgi:hypothetical protein